jgi:predicted ribosome quality control (RQC) complex YloA/Tae2 family protein
MIRAEPFDCSVQLVPRGVISPAAETLLACPFPPARNMNEVLLQIIADELAHTLAGGSLVRVYQLAAARLALDIRAEGNRLLFISAEPARPRVYLIRRPSRSIEREQLPPQQFALLLRKHLAGARLDSVTKDAGDRLLRFTFRGTDELGNDITRTLVAGLTGRSTNLFLLDGDERVIDSLRPSHGDGQLPGDTYRTPPQPAPDSSATGKRSSATTDELLRLIHEEAARSPSEVIDEYDLAFERRTRFGQRAAAELARLRRDLSKRTKMERNLRADLRAHGDPLTHKRTGELLLANIATAEREGAHVRLTDYFAEDAPQIEIEIDENHTLQEAAARSFTRYTKAKRAGEN